jgi:DNA-binding winged helix-turn-helix (wHTH) protein
MQGDFRIGDRTVVPSLNQILHGGAAVHVEPKVMRVLLCLAARRGEVARREELIQEVWSDTFVTDDVLKRCISDLRKALGDDYQEPRFIETIQKVGYRLITAVERAEPSEEARRARLPASPSAPTLPRGTGPQAAKADADSQAAMSTAVIAYGPRRRWTAITIGGVLIIGAATAATVWTLRPRKVLAPLIIQLSAERLVSSSSFSPDGSQIAYSSVGNDGDNWDIWLKIVGEAEARRLTTDEAADTWPAWSPTANRSRSCGSLPLARTWVVSTSSRLSVEWNGGCWISRSGAHPSRGRPTGGGWRRQRPPPRRPSSEQGST